MTMYHSTRKEWLLLTSSSTVAKPEDYLFGIVETQPRYLAILTGKTSPSTKVNRTRPAPPSPLHI